MMDKERIYDLMTGQVMKDVILVAERAAIKDEFGDGERCAVLYEQVYLEKRNLCERLQENEVAEVESIITDMFEMTRILALQMYEYGRMRLDERTV